MKEYMIGLGSVIMMISFAEILMPEGSVRSFATLAMGFMVITAVVMPLGSMGESFVFSAESFSLDEASLEKAEAEYRAGVLKEHRENITEKINEKIKHGSKVAVEVSPDGEITRVTIVLKGDESAAVEYIINTLGVPRERIKTEYENN